MANAHSFPLFRLPLLAYENVIDIMHLKEKFNLSATSNKISQKIKRYNLRKKHNLIIFLSCRDCSARLFVYVDRGDKYHMKDSNSWNYDFGNHRDLVVDPTVGDEDDVVVDPVLLLPVVTQITQMASVAPTASLRLKFFQTLPEIATTFIPLAERLNLTLNSVERVFIGLGPDDEQCRYVFENCRHAQTLEYCADTEPGFTLNPDIMGSYFFEHFVLNVSWITVNHLKKCFDSCKYIELSETKFSVEDMNDFLKHWVQGSKVQTLLLTSNDPEFEVANLLVGIPAVTHQHVHDKTYPCVASPGYIIKNKEGIKALIHNTKHDLTLTTDFEIVDETFSLDVSSDEDEEEDSDGED